MTRMFFFRGEIALGDCARRNHRAEEARFAAEVIEDFGFGGEPVIGQP